LKKFYKILVVDDEPGIRTFLERFLSLSLYKVKTLSKGKEALNEMNNNPDEYDLMLLDVNLENENGFDTAREIKKI